MIAKTRHKKAKANFNYSDVKKRIQKQYRKKFKEKVSLTEIDEIWKAYVDSAITARLVRGRKVEIITGFGLEVVGRRVIDNDAIRRLFENGLQIYPSGVLTPAKMLSPMRREYYYKIECNNSNFKSGKLYFKADEEIRQKVHNVLCNTGQYFRIDESK